MAETQQQEQQEETRQDEHGNDFDMSAHIPEGTDGISDVEINQEAKLNDIGEGVHKTSGTFGDVVSQDATDAAGLTPEELAERKEGGEAAVLEGGTDDKGGDDAGKSGKKSKK